MSNVRVDDNDFQTKITDYVRGALMRKEKALMDIASELLRFSQEQVPHDKGSLQNSGMTEMGIEESIVAYQTPYAARLHEHPEYHFQKGRKGKYLEDPLKQNLTVWRKYYQEIVDR